MRKPATRVANVFAGLPENAGQEHFLTLFQGDSMKIERIVSRSHSSPPGFWYDQAEDEWVIVLRGRATLEFENGGLVEMSEGDHLLIPSHARHRVDQTNAETIWLAVRDSANRSTKDCDGRPL
jgi:cupin 2 domain-containing protein